MTRKSHKAKKEKVRQPTPAQLEELKEIVEEASRLTVLCTCHMPEIKYPCGMCNWSAFLGYHGMKGTLKEAAYTGAHGDAICFFMYGSLPTFGVANQVRFTTAGRAKTKPTVYSTVINKMSKFTQLACSGYKDVKDNMVPMVSHLLAMLVEESLKAKLPMMDRFMENSVNVERIEKLCGGYHAVKASMRFKRS